MPTCPLCNQNFATKPEFDRHECAEIEATRDLPSRREESWPEKAAYYSWRLPVIALGISLLSRSIQNQPQTIRIVMFGVLGLYMFGLFCSLTAVRHVIAGRLRGAAAPAVIGLMLNAGMLSLIGYGIYAAHELQVKLEGEAPPPQVLTPAAETACKALQESGQTIATDSGTLRIPAAWKALPKAADPQWVAPNSLDNIILKESGEVGNLETLANTVESALVSSMKNYAPLSRTAFTSRGGARVVKFVYTFGDERRARQCLYMLQASSARPVLAIYGTSTLEAPQDDQFDACIATFTPAP